MKLRLFAATLVGLFALTGCNEDAKVAGDNLTKAADNFEITRRIVFLNSITDKYMLEIVGRCSFGPSGSTPKTVNVICKLGPTEYKKHSMVMGDNTVVVVEHLKATNVSVDFYRVTFKPLALIPDIDIRGPGLDQESKK